MSAMSNAGRLPVVVPVSVLGAVLGAVAVGAFGWRTLAGSPEDGRPTAQDHQVTHPEASAPPSTGAPPRASPAPAGPPLVDARAVRVLRDWDARRARAYAQGDVAALRRLYLPGSRAGAADVRLLAAYTARGLVVRGLRVQLLEVEARARGRDTLRLRVTERVTGARAVPARGPGRLLPRDAPSTHLLTMRRHEGRWRVASVA